MPISPLENKQFEIVNPVEVDKSINELRKMLAKMSWVSNPYHIAQRFYKKDEKTKQVYYYPETYVASGTDKNLPYHRLTPDNKYSGMFFFMVGTGRPTDDGFITYPVGIIFSANLEIIGKPKLKNYLFTQELIQETRKILRLADDVLEFKVELKEETRDLREVYKEFALDDLESYNRAPLQCFRFNLLLTIAEEC